MSTGVIWESFATYHSLPLPLRLLDLSIFEQARQTKGRKAKL